MKFLDRFKNVLRFTVACLAFIAFDRPMVAQLTPGFTVTASDNADFLGQTLFPDSEGNPFRFDSAFLDFGFEALFPEEPIDPEDPLGPTFPMLGGFDDLEEQIPAAPQGSIGTFINNSAVYGIGDPGNTVRTGVAISSGFVENYGAGPNFSASTSEFFSTTASEEQTNLLREVSSTVDDFQDTTSLSINFTNVTQSNQVLDLFAVFGTEETPDFVGSAFNDGFGVFLNGQNIALQGGAPLNVDHPNHLPVSGTELDTVITSSAANGVTLPYVDLSTTVPIGSHELVIVLGDATDDGLDSTAYLSRDVTDQPVTGVALLPTTIAENGDFLFENIDLPAGEPIFIDPEIAIGYEYSVEELPGEVEALFGTVRVDPAGFDTEFTVNYFDQNGAEFFADIAAGEVFVFPEEADVLSFSILDIDPEQLLPADNPLAFATLLTFRNALNGATIIQAPISISAIPEPGAGLLLGVSMSLALMRRRKLA